LGKVCHGCVWDYLSFFGYFYFNVFDVLVVLGLVLLTLGQIQPKILKEGGTYE
jgi:lipoprotein signal peptidase